MEITKKLNAFFEKRFEKHPIWGYIVYGIFLGFIGSAVLILIFLGISAALGLYSRLGINYKTWYMFMVIAALIGILFLIIGAWAYFPYKRKGNSLFKKEYVKGNSYKALSEILKNNNEGENEKIDEKQI